MHMNDIAHTTADSVYFLTGLETGYARTGWLPGGLVKQRVSAGEDNVDWRCGAEGHATCCTLTRALDMALLQPSVVAAGTNEYVERCGVAFTLETHLMKMVRRGAGMVACVTVTRSVLCMAVMAVGSGECTPKTVGISWTGWVSAYADTLSVVVCMKSGLAPGTEMGRALTGSGAGSISVHNRSVQGSSAKRGGGVGEEVVAMGGAVFVKVSVASVVVNVLGGTWSNSGTTGLSLLVVAPSLATTMTVATFTALSGVTLEWSMGYATGPPCRWCRWCCSHAAPLRPCL